MLVFCHVILIKQVLEIVMHNGDDNQPPLACNGEVHYKRIFERKARFTRSFRESKTSNQAKPDIAIDCLTCFSEDGFL